MSYDIDFAANDSRAYYIIFRICMQGARMNLFAIILSLSMELCSIPNGFKCTRQRKRDMIQRHKGCPIRLVLHLLC